VTALALVHVLGILLMLYGLLHLLLALLAVHLRRRSKVLFPRRKDPCPHNSDTFGGSAGGGPYLSSIAAGTAAIVRALT